MHIQTEDKTRAEPYLMMKHYHVACEVGQAVALKDSEKYQIRVCVGGDYFYFDPMDQDVGNYKRYPRQILSFQLPYESVDTIDTIAF